MLSKSKKPSTTNKSITSKSHTKLDEESMIVKLLSNKITNKTADEITESVYNATSIIDTNITVSSLITIIPPSKSKIFFISIFHLLYWKKTNVETLWKHGKNKWDNEIHGTKSNTFYTETYS